MWKHKLSWLGLCVLCFFTTTGFLDCADNTLDCALSGDNLRGRINFTSTVAVRRGAPLVIEASTNSFVSVSSRSRVINEQGLVTVPYSLCLANDTNYTLRAYQDVNDDTAINAGDGSGLYDDTANGNATALTVSVPKLTNEWNIKTGIHLSLDVAN